MENRDGFINSVCEEGKVRKVGSVENNVVVVFGKIFLMGRKNWMNENYFGKYFCYLLFKEMNLKKGYNYVWIGNLVR